MLSEMADGCNVKMTYDFHKVLKSGGGEIAGSEMQKMLEASTRGWSAEMSTRGYAKCKANAGGGLDFGFTPRGSVVRSAARMKADLEEEAAMKAALQPVSA